MIKKHSVIIIPGLGDPVGILRILTAHWKIYGLNPIIHRVGWKDGEEFQPKLAKITDLIDKLVAKGDTVSLVGTSAGGSAAVNAFILRRNKIHRIINVCGRLRTGPEEGYRSFQLKTAGSKAFAQSVKLAEAKEPELTKTDRKKIMTVHAMFGDELVPPETVSISGAYNTSVPTGAHMLSIGAALSVFPSRLIKFIKYYE